MDDSPHAVGGSNERTARKTATGDAAQAGTPPESLRQRALRGVLWASVEKWSVRLSTFLAFVVLGRLLDPAAFGVVALAMGFIALLTVVSDAGFTMYLVQARHIDRRVTNTAFYISLCLGLLLTTLLVAASSVIATALDSAQLAQVLPALAVAVFIASGSSVPAALLARELRFRELAIRQSIATGLSVVVAVALAFAGAGVWALVGQHLVRTVVAFIMLWITTDFRPGLVFSRREARTMIGFGSSALLVQMGQQVREQGEPMLIGAIAGTTPLGYWSVAGRLVGVAVDLFSSVVNLVAQPVFARVQEDRARLGRALSTSSAAGALLLSPALVTLALLSPLIVPLLFGSKWGPAAAIAAALSIRSLVLGLSDFQRSALIAIGRPDVELGVSAVLLTGQAVIIVAVIDEGLVTLAWWLVAWMVLAWPLRAVVLWRLAGVGLRSYSETARVLLAAGAGTALTLGLTHFLDLDVAGYVAAGIAGLACYAGLTVLMCRRFVRDLTGSLRTLVTRRRGRDAVTTAPGSGR